MTHCIEFYAGCFPGVRMTVKIRLARFGKKKRPFYRIVVANSFAPRDGRFIERIGFYDPILPRDSKTRVVLKVDRLKYWLSVGAQPTKRVLWFIKGCQSFEKEDDSVKEIENEVKRC